MPEYDVVLQSSRVGNLITDLSAVRAYGGANAPGLMLVARLRLQAVREDAQEGGPARPVTPLSVAQASAFLNIPSADEFAHAPWADADLETLNFPRPTDTGITFRFPLTAHKVRQLEETRNAGDMHLDFRIRLRLAMHEPCEEAQEQHRSRGTFTGWRRSPVERFATSYTQVMLDVPKSTWARDFLPNLGFGKRHVVEIEVPAAPNDARFERAMGHLNAASQALAAGDAPGAMTRCWNVWEAVVVEFLGQGKTPQRDSFAELLARARLPVSKADKLKALMYDLAAFNHIGRHDRDAAPMPVDNRDAEFAVVTTQIALGYLSRLGVFSPPVPDSLPEDGSP